MLHTVARHPVFIINEPKLLFRCLAFLHCHLTASVEGTSAGRIDGTGYIPFEHNPFAGPVHGWIGNWDSGKKGYRIGMLGI